MQARRHHGINVARFAPILAKRWKRNPAKKACELPELKALAWYSEALRQDMREEVCAEIERLARDLLKQGEVL
jgi:hypothetical protein